MKRLFTCCAFAVLLCGSALADEATKSDASKPEAQKSQAQKSETPKPEVKEMSGISILGNQEAPKSLVIVPWKSSEIGKGIGLSSSLNDRPVPVDKQVFGRQVRYYEIRSGVARE
jgi:hypothetical protein